eukprot:179471-Pelagomonas_calceolata.AAC.2
MRSMCKQKHSIPNQKLGYGIEGREELPSKKLFMNPEDQRHLPPAAHAGCLDFSLEALHDLQEPGWAAHLLSAAHAAGRQAPFPARP